MPGSRVLRNLDPGRQRAIDRMRRAAGRAVPGLVVPSEAFGRAALVDELALARGNALRAAVLADLGDLDLALRCAYEASLVACQALVHGCGLDARGEGAHGVLLRGARGYFDLVGSDTLAEAIDEVDQVLRPMRHHLQYRVVGTVQRSTMARAQAIAADVLSAVTAELSTLHQLGPEDAPSAPGAGSLEEAIEAMARRGIGR